VAVSASDVNGTFASFSTYGNFIDISAPGNNVLTTMTGGGYGYWWGTSFSSPIAAGVAALVLSLQPGMSNSQLVSLLEQNADDLGTPGWDQYFGYGQVNAYKAVVAAQAPPTKDTIPPTVSISSPSSGATVSGTVSVQGSATDNVGVTSIQFAVDGTVVASSSTSPFSFSLNTINYGNGSHTLTVVASDAAGNQGSASVSVNVTNSAPVNTAPPVVAIKNPVNGGIVSGSVSISVSVTDASPVSQVSIYIDNQLRCTDTIAPYACSWNTRKVSTGSHTIAATVWDAAGNSASTSITVRK
jgi:hypothetical protein